MDRGRRWTPFFHYWCHNAEAGLYRGVDGLLQKPSKIRQLSQRIPSVFWAEAIRDWSTLRYAMPDLQQGEHREAAGALPVLARYISDRDRANPRPEVQLLKACSLLYLSDYWDMARLNWCDADSLTAVLATKVHLSAATIPSTLKWVRRWVERLEEKIPDHVAALETNRVEAQPEDGPKVGEIWADPSSSPMMVGVVKEVDDTHTGPLERNGEDRDECICGDEYGSQGDCIKLDPIPHVEAAGTWDPDHSSPVNQWVTCCSCNLTPVYTTSTHLYGAMSLTALAPHLLSSQLMQPEEGGDPTALTLSASIRQLRQHFLRLQRPASFSPSPEAEHKWIAELAFHNHEIRSYQQAKLLTSAAERAEAVSSHPSPTPDIVRTLISTPQAIWRARWMSISRVQMSGPVRSFLFRLMHRRLPLLSAPWRANFYNRDSSCLMCSQQHPESYSHLFSECDLATRMWQEIQPITTCIQPTLDHHDPRPARLIGDISHADLQRVLGEWPQGAAAPSPATSVVGDWMRDTWNEVRATVAYPIWIARCSVLAGSLSRDEARDQAALQARHLLRTLTYGKIPSLMGGIPQPNISEARSTFNQLIWGKVAHLLLFQRHLPPPPPPPPAPPNG